MLAGWASFYQVTGEGAAALVGLLFLVVTLASEGDRSRMQEAAALFTTPTVTAFGSVVLVSALALAPPPHDGWAIGLILVCMIWNLGYYAKTARGLIRFDTTHWSDFWFYGAAPIAATAGLAGAATLLLLHRAVGAPALAAGVLTLLILAIRNAWDLIVWLAPRRGQT